MKSLFWLSYQRDHQLACVVIIKARELLEARMLAAIDGLDGGAQFVEGYELHAAEAAMISLQSIGRMLTPAEVSQLIAWIESEASRTNRQVNHRHLRSIDRLAIESALFDEPKHCLPAEAVALRRARDKPEPG
jgi:hypothetical protein